MAGPVRFIKARGWVDRRSAPGGRRVIFTAGLLTRIAVPYHRSAPEVVNGLAASTCVRTEMPYNQNEWLGCALHHFGLVVDDKEKVRRQLESRRQALSRERSGVQGSVGKPRANRGVRKYPVHQAQGSSRRYGLRRPPQIARSYRGTCQKGNSGQRELSRSSWPSDAVAKRLHTFGVGVACGVRSGPAIPSLHNVRPRRRTPCGQSRTIFSRGPGSLSLMATTSMVF